MSKFHKGNIRARKLTASQVLEMRELYHEQAWTQSALARRYQVSVITVGRIVRGESWQSFAMPVNATDIADAEAIVDSAQPVDLNLPPDFADELAALQKMPVDPSIIGEFGAGSGEEVDAVEEYLRRSEEKAK